MSGHSHWHSIKYKKGIADAKKSKVFSKIAREITVTAKESGGDPNFNPKLRLAVEKARSFNMPADNIERSIKKGTGEIEGAVLENINLEAYGPGGITIIIEGITDNKNRALAEIKQILNQNGGKLVGEGAIKWMFERKGVLIIDSQLKNKDELEMAAIEAGAENIYWHDNFLDVYTKPEELELVKKGLENKGIKLDSVSLDWVAKENIEINKEGREAAEKLFSLLDENDAVQEIYSNFKT